MLTAIEADGDDLVVVMPPEIMAQAGLQVGDKIEWSFEDGVVIIKWL